MTPSSPPSHRGRSADVVARTPPVPLILVLAALLLDLLSSIDSFYIELGERHLIALARWSGGWLRPDLTHSAIAGLIVIGGVILGLGRLRPRHLGLEARHVVGWLLALIGTWTAFQLLLLAAGALGDGPTWQPRLPTRFELQLLVMQVLVTGVVEEVLFRGFLLPQAFHRLTRILTPERALAAAIVGSSVVFALFHIPVRLAEGHRDALTLGGSLLALVWIGALYAWIYVRSGNLLVAAAVHAICNAPTAVLTSPADDELTNGLRGVVQLGAALGVLLVRRPVRAAQVEVSTAE